MLPCYSHVGYKEIIESSRRSLPFAAILGLAPKTVPEGKVNRPSG